MTGFVSSIPEGKYFGFISIEGMGKKGKEIFFHQSDFKGHWSDLVEDFRDGRIKIDVEFDVVDTPKGPRASNVRRLDYPNQYPKEER